MVNFVSDEVTLQIQAKGQRTSMNLLLPNLKMLSLVLGWSAERESAAFVPSLTFHSTEILKPLEQGKALKLMGVFLACTIAVQLFRTGTKKTPDNRRKSSSG
jgi:hypothetical protein